MSGPEPGFGGPQHGLGSLASPPRPQRLQTVLGTPGVLVLLTEDSMSKAASADIYCFVSVNRHFTFHLLS